MRIGIFLTFSAQLLGPTLREILKSLPELIFMDISSLKEKFDVFVSDPRIKHMKTENT